MIPKKNNYLYNNLVFSIDYAKIVANGGRHIFSWIKYNLCVVVSTIKTSQLSMTSYVHFQCKMKASKPHLLDNWYINKAPPSQVIRTWLTVKSIDFNSRMQTIMVYTLNAIYFIKNICKLENFNYEKKNFLTEIAF